MTTTTKQRLDQVLALDEQERSELIECVSESLETDKEPGHDQTWESELRERISHVGTWRGEVDPLAGSHRKPGSR